MQQLYAYVINGSTQSQTVFWQKLSVYSGAPNDNFRENICSEDD